MANQKRGTQFGGTHLEAWWKIDMGKKGRKIGGGQGGWAFFGAPLPVAWAVWPVLVLGLGGCGEGESVLVAGAVLAM